MKETSMETKRKVYSRWKGRCAFCGVELPIEQHHIVPKNENPSLINDPDNLVLLCSNHHALTQKLKPNGKHVISFSDIKDVSESKEVVADKNGCYFSIPQSFIIDLGSNKCAGCPYVLVVNGKPLIEIWPQKSVHYTEEIKLYLHIRFFDEENNFIGGMFANHWASVSNEEWGLNISNTTIKIRHKTKPIYMKLDKTDILRITGIFYFDGIKIEAKEQGLVLPIENRFSYNSVWNSEVAFKVAGKRLGASICIGGTL